jgi:CDP-diacylglycerol--glycerol-3-phosphate 3-phosphatidyltransferase
MTSHAKALDFRWNLPNALSALRMALVPTLFFVAFLGEAGLFLALVTCALATDVLDGWLARALHQESAAGSLLDSRADLALWLSLPLCTWWLRPDFVRGEAHLVVLLLVAFALPVAFGWAKFRALTSYHTWGAKLSANLLGAALLVVWAGGPAWPFEVAAGVTVLALLEELVITRLLPEPRQNVRSSVHVWRSLRSDSQG